MTDPHATLDLLQRWHAGDREALDTLLQRDLEWIRGYVHRQLGPQLRRAGDTEDFVQEAALAVLRDGPRFVLQSREQFRALLAKIVVNLLRGRHRHRLALKRTPERERELASDTRLDLDRPARSVTRPDSAAAQNEEREWLRMGILLLDPDDQAVLDLHWQDLTDGEIGKRVGAADNTVRMRRVRATERLTRAVLRLKAGKVGEMVEEE